MVDAGDWKKIVAGISDAQVLKLEQAAIRIPSTTFEEGTLADYLAVQSPVSPSIQGRIVCTDSNGTGVAPDCPVITAP